MGKKVAANPNPGEQKEGHHLLGEPTFEQLENGRFRCVETGHELPVHARESYADSKHCRLGLINSALARNKPPLNMFNQDPASRSKLICKLTGDAVNKSEEHIWKHINGRRFLNMLERKEAGTAVADGATKKRIEENVEEIIQCMRDSTGTSSGSEDNTDFWMPPAGERWDDDDGGDRWRSDSESGPENGDDVGKEDAGTEQDKHEAVELSRRTKRMSLEIGPSSFASRKKKKKTNNGA